MKKIFIFSLLLVSSVLVNAQIIFESNFDNWNDTLPNDWQGSRRVFFSDSVFQITDAPVYGTASARLENYFGSHRTMASMPVAVVEGEYYDVEVWVRGLGQIRTNLWDNELSDGDAGYGPWNPYVNVDSDTLVSFVQQISPEQTISSSEILLSINLGAVIVDRVEVRVGEAPIFPIVSITEVQSNTLFGDATVYQDSAIILSGIVSAVGANRYFLQETPGDWGGIEVFDFANTPSLGDDVTIQGTVYEVFGGTQVQLVEEHAVNSSGNAFGITDIQNFELPEEELEGVLVHTTGLCTEGVSAGIWTISDGTSFVKVSELMFPHTPTLGWSYEVTGMVVRADGSNAIAPRFAADIIGAVGLEESVEIDLSFYPNPATEQVFVQVDERAIGAELSILASNGQLISSDTILTTQNSVDVSSLAAGNYIIRITGNGVRAVKSIQVR